MVSWFIARHVFYGMVCYSAWARSGILVPDACFYGTAENLTGPIEPPTKDGYGYMLEPFMSSEGLVCFNRPIRMWFVYGLLLLQLLIIAWFLVIIQVAIRVIKGAGADDSRSDDELEGEDEDEDEDEELQGEGPPLEVEVGVESIDLKSWEQRAGVKRHAASATGMSLPGHSDRKELLGRIGCEKQVE